MKKILLACLFAFSLQGAQWRSHGPAGGPVRALAAAPANDRVLYVATAGGVFRSVDGGSTWRDVTGPVSAPNALAVASETLAYAANDGNDDSLHRTADGGETWTLIGDGLPSPLDVSAIVVDPRDANVVYVASRCQPFFSGSPRAQYHEGAGAFKSTDGGVTFSRAGTGLAGFQACVEGLVLDPLHPDTIYATPVYSDSGWGRSDDGGASWTTAATFLPGRDVVADPRDPNRRYGGTFRMWGTATLLTSTDAGLTWTALRSTRLESGETLRMTSTALAMDPASGRLFLGGEFGAFRSGDGGNSVLELGGAGREDVSGIVVDRTSGTVTIGTATGVYQSRRFPWSEWTELALGDSSLRMIEVASSQRQPGTIYASSGPRVYVTPDNGRTWAVHGQRLIGDALSVRGLTVDVAETVFAIVGGGAIDHVLKLPADSSEWIELDLPVWTIHSIDADPGTPGVVYLTTTGGVLATRDDGASWILLKTPEGAFAWDLRIDPRDGAVLYVVTAKGLMKSTDGGHTWQLKLEAADIVSIIDLSRADGKTLYATGHISPTERGLFQSSDGGDTWTPRTLPADGSVLSIAADAHDAQTVYVSLLSGGIFRSRNGGATWEELGTGWPHLPAALTIDRDATVLHAATFKGMWELSLTPERRRAVTPRR